MGRVRTLIALSAVLVLVALATLFVVVDGSPAPAGRATSRATPDQDPEKPGVLQSLRAWHGPC